jgi:hypothetical protein
MIRTLLGVVLSGTLLLGWCWYYSDHLPQHLQRVGWIGPPPNADGSERAEPKNDDGEPVVSQVKAGPMEIGLLQKNPDSGKFNFRLIGMGLASFLGVALVASLLLTMAGLRSYVARVGFVFLLGVFATVLVQVSEYLFWQHTSNWVVTAYKSAFFLSAALMAGLVLAAFVRPQPTPVRIPVKVRS